jgi:hypothetical protein
MKISHKEKVEWRKDQIQQLLAKGHYSHREIAGILQIPKSTVSKDILTLRQEARNSIRKYIDERLPEEYERILVGVTSILREAWETSGKEEIDTKEKIQALALAKECYSMKLDLLTNATVVSDAVRFVSEKSKLSSSLDGRQFNRLDYNENGDQSKKLSNKGQTTNQVF